jgi:predicted transcriptional regulator
MSTLYPTVSVQLPKTIFHRLQRVAQVTHRSVEDVLATTVDAALPQASDIPADLADELAAMTMFNDEALWAATESSLSPAQQRRLDQLAHAGGSRALTAAESAELADLLDLRDRAVLRRARAMAILSHRGFEIPAGQPAGLEE